VDSLERIGALLPLITYADGVTPFPPDQRDERKGGGLGTSSTQKRRRECDTTTNRFPDCLWMRRDEHGRALLAISVETDVVVLDSTASVHNRRSRLAQVGILVLERLPSLCVDSRDRIGERVLFFYYPK
tara:strand:+ start:3407 stop:3793 length:387 start_codon:yes stop_codon:yes gene_type:complete